MKKIFVILVMVLASTASVMAQAPEKGLSWAVETGIGSEWEIGGRAQYNLNRYLALEAVAKYAYDYNKQGDVNEITIQPGVRAFSPEFGPKLKAFAAMDLGYGVMFDGTANAHCFAMDITAGLYVWKGLYCGYGYGGLFHDGHHNDHVFRIGYNF